MAQEKSKLNIEKSKLNIEVATEEQPLDGANEGTIKDQIKTKAISKLSRVIQTINFVPPFNGTITYAPLQRIWELKKEIEEKYPNWTLTSDDEVLETLVFSKIDSIDHTRPWNSDRNKLRYIDLFQTITKLRVRHPSWSIEDLNEVKNSCTCKCHYCVKKKEEIKNKDTNVKR